MAKNVVSAEKQQSQGSKEKAFASAYLEHVKLTNFGKFANMIVGPFKPGLNVVYGANEAGKTTISELIKGVMFGWPASRKGINSYKPENTERIGSLFFKDMKTGDVEELKRAKNSEGVTDALHVLDDIDKETYDTMFALTSDELLKLDRHNEVTARLLTAGSGTAASPALVLGSIQEKLKAKMSRSAQNQNSIALLREQQAEAKTQVQELLNETEGYRDHEKHLKSLEVRKEALEETQGVLNSEIEDLQANRARLESIDSQLLQNEKLLEETITAQNQASMQVQSGADEEVLRLSKLSDSEEYQLKNALDDLEDERARLDRACENAKNDADKSQHAFEAFVSNYDQQAEHDHAKKQRWVRLAVALLITAFMIVMGIWLFRQGRAVGSLSYSTFGLIICLCALLVAAAGIVANIHPSKTEEAFEKQRRDHEYIKQKDDQHLASCEHNLQAHMLKIKQFLDSNGFKLAQGSIRQARYLLDLAHEVRNNEEVTQQNLSALALQRASLESLVERLRCQRKELCLEAGLDPQASPADLDRVIDRKDSERKKTQQLISETNLQYGEISSELARARHTSAFDEAKQNKEVIEARLEEEYYNLATLLLAQKTLEVAISEWERKSQPEVYKQASRLFSQMTKGAWQTVRMNAEGQIEVLDSVKTAVSPHLLSLGTRQQLYLALRVALLITAENVGRSLPILCDDILVNFDEERRKEAVKVLVELSNYRQVILFTCHPSIAALVRESDCSCNYVEL